MSASASCRGIVHGLVVETPAPLPWAGAVRGGEPDLLLEILPPAAPTLPPVPLSVQIPGVRGEPWLSTGRLPGGGLFLRFAGSADFKVDGTGTRVLCRPLEGLSAQEAVDLFAEGVVPFLLDHRGDTVLHAGAAVLATGAVAILGESGAGKSTLTAALGRAGHPLLGDDVLVLRRRGDGFEATPGLRRVDLLPGSLRLVGLEELAGRAEDASKARVVETDGAFRFAAEAAPLRSIVLLQASGPQDGGGAALGPPLRPKDAVAVLADHLFRAVRQDEGRFAGELDRLCALAEAVPVRRLRGHRGAGGLAAAVRLAAESCAAAAGEAARP